MLWYKVLLIFNVYSMVERVMAEQAVLKQLQADILKASVAERNAISMDVVVHELIDSTNSWSLQQTKMGRILPFACFAEVPFSQDIGRHVYQRQWSPCGFHTHCYLSLLYDVSHHG